MWSKHRLCYPLQTSHAQNRPASERLQAAEWTQLKNVYSNHEKKPPTWQAGSTTLLSMTHNGSARRQGGESDEQTDMESVHTETQWVIKGFLLNQRIDYRFIWWLAKLGNCRSKRNGAIMGLWCGKWRFRYVESWRVSVHYQRHIYLCLWHYETKSWF